MKERIPVDKYSKSAYEAGIDRLSNVEKSIQEHPLHAELDLHQELKKDSPSPYPLKEDEAKVREDLEAETAVFRAEVEKIKQDLWRQLGNAQTEAMRTNDEIKSREIAQVVLLQISKISDNTHHQMEESGNLSRRAQYFGQAVLDEAEAAKREITSKRPSPAPESIQTTFKVLQELYRQFANLADNVLLQDKYGHAVGDTAI